MYMEKQREGGEEREREKLFNSLSPGTYKLIIHNSVRDA